MALFKKDITIEQINQLRRNTLAEHLDIEFTHIGENTLEARMPVDHRTHQPYGLLHGGASVALAETLGSVAAACSVDQSQQLCVGLEINANHIKSVRDGYVTGVAAPLHVGKKTHVWEIRISNAADELVCISRITVAILDKKH